MKTDLGGPTVVFQEAIILGITVARLLFLLACTRVRILDDDRLGI